MVEQRWYADWRAALDASGAGDSAVGPVDNSPLLEPSGALKRDLGEGVDYALVEASVWEKIAEWYGGGPALERPMIELGFVKKRLVVEVYPMTLHVQERRARPAAATSSRSFDISKIAPVRQLVEAVCRAWSVPPHRCQLWKLGANGYELLPLSASLLQSGVDEDTQLVLEEMLPDGTYEATPPPWVRPKLEPGAAAFMAMAGRFDGGGGGWGRGAGPAAPVLDSTTPAPRPGISGLVNVGNTCFMNSSLQCLLALPGPRRFFTDERAWKPLVNKSNPLGTQGRIVGAMAKLFAQVWAKDCVTYVVPRELKKVVSDWAPQFEGYRQHDAQEFVAFLLDGLHEDLNTRPKHAAVVNEPAGAGEAALARAAWAEHLQRNHSEVVTWFHGQLRSRLQCPSCHETSVAFDAMSVLSLPLPVAQSRSIVVNFVPLASRGGRVMRVSVPVVTNGNVAELKARVREWIAQPSCALVAGEVYQGVLWRDLGDACDVYDINPTDNVFAFEVEHEPNASGASVCQCVPRSAAGQLVGAWQWPLIWTLRSASAASLLASVRERLVALGMDTTLAASATLRFTGKSGKSCGVPCADASCTGCVVTASSDALLRRTEDPTLPRARINLALTFADDESLEFFRSLSVERGVIEPPQSAVRAQAQAAPPVERVTLESCVQRFVAAEVLGANDMWFCPTCRAHVQAQKQISLWTLPRVLVVHLKRFAQITPRHREKLGTLVEFPVLGLDLSAYAQADSQCVYDLVGVCNHMGGLAGGHYTAFTLHMDSHEWWLYNDQTATVVTDVASVVSPSAYLLFYVRRDVTS